MKRIILTFCMSDRSRWSESTCCVLKCLLVTNKLNRSIAIALNRRSYQFETIGRKGHTFEYQNVRFCFFFLCNKSERTDSVFDNNGTLIEHYYSLHISQRYVRILRIILFVVERSRYFEIPICE